MKSAYLLFLLVPCLVLAGPIQTQDSQALYSVISSPTPTKYSINPLILQAKERIVEVVGSEYDPQTKTFIAEIFGTGFHIDKNYVLTCEHLRHIWLNEVSPRGAIKQRYVKLIDRLTIDGNEVTIVGYDTKLDLMLLKAALAKEVSPIQWATDVVQTEPVTLISNAENLADLQKTVSLGHVTNVGPSVIITDNQAVPRSSGGMVINSWGQTVGIVFAKYADIQVDRMTYLRSADQAQTFLADLVKLNAFAELDNPQHLPVETAAAERRP